MGKHVFMFTCLELKKWFARLLDHWNYDMLCFDAFSILWEPSRDTGKMA
jgi:hypothetical protein